MHTEFILIFIDYFSIQKKKVLLFEWIIPAIIGVLCLVLSFVFNIDKQYMIIEKSLGYIGSLLGFTMAALTLLISNNKIKDVSEYKVERVFHNREATLYDIVVASYTYLIVLEGILCISFFVAQLLNFLYFRNIAVILNSIYIVLLFNVLLVTIRIISDMYFILTK